MMAPGALNVIPAVDPGPESGLAQASADETLLVLILEESPGFLFPLLLGVCVWQQVWPGAGSSCPLPAPGHVFLDQRADLLAISKPQLSRGKMPPEVLRYFG